MDEDNSLNIRNWGYYEPTTVKGNLGLQLMAPTMPEKPFSGSRSAAIMTSMNGETSSANHMQMFQPPNSENDEILDQVEGAGVVEKENGPDKKKQRPKALKCLKAKKGKRGPQVPKPDGSPSAQQGKSAKKTVEIMINGISMDISLFPIPVCSCTGTPQQCYRWGCVLARWCGFIRQSVGILAGVLRNKLVYVDAFCNSDVGVIDHVLVHLTVVVELLL
ncbi:hypothetical protein D5086_023030 [Populus alba]|uniref:Uncharacterized protein n=1 Tax=Populus alba TaxID=43335 RepID=A0ACC4BA84_POPAL